MIYPKGKNVGEILSPYLQKKAHKFIEAGLYKQESTAIATQEKVKNLKRENRQLKKAITKSDAQIHSLNLKVAKTKYLKAKQILKVHAAI